MTNESSNSYFILKYSPDGEESPYFFGTEWTPDLPSIHYPSGELNLDLISEEYVVNTEIESYGADLNMDQLLASDYFVSTCKELEIDYLSRPVKLLLTENKKPKKGYHLFLPLTRAEIMDTDKSQYTLCEAPSDSKTPQVKNYDTIKRLVIKNSLRIDLAYCVEVKEFICSERAKDLFESRNLVGLSFLPIDNSYKFQPWDDFCT